MQSLNLKVMTDFNPSRGRCWQSSSSGGNRRIQYIGEVGKAFKIVACSSSSSLREDDGKANQMSRDFLSRSQTYALLKQQMDVAAKSEMFKRVLGVHHDRQVFLTDRDLALKNAIESEFPNAKHILCIWHINKNILAHCKPLFQRMEVWNAFIAQWNDLVDSSSAETFNGAFEAFKQDFSDYSEAVNYITRTWIPHKKQFVKAWIGWCLHFGNSATSRVEGAHSVLKHYIANSTSDLYVVRRKISHAIENQFQNFKIQIEDEKIRFALTVSIPFFDEVNGRVSQFALSEVFKQYVMVRNLSFSPTCTEVFTASMGLPCAHILLEIDKLHLDQIHPQWRIDLISFDEFNSESHRPGDELDVHWECIKNKYGSMSSFDQEDFRDHLKDLASDEMNISQPIMQYSRGRHPGSKNATGQTSTRRDPSAFEIIENSLNGRKCRICKNTGYNARTCPNRSSAQASSSVDLNTLPALGGGIHDSQTTDLSQLSQVTDSYNFYDDSTYNSANLSQWSGDTAEHHWWNQ